MKNGVGDLNKKGKGTLTTNQFLKPRTIQLRLQLLDDQSITITSRYNTELTRKRNGKEGFEHVF
jgi:hypothetical protein